MTTHNKNNFFFISLFVALLSFSLGLRAESPLITINDKINILFTGNAQFLYYDNLFYEEDNEVDETIFVFTPGFEVNLGNPKNKAYVIFNISEEFKEYTENSDLDTSNTFAQIKGHYNSPLLKTEASLSFKETDQLTADLAEEISQGEFVERDLVNFNSYAEYELSPKTSFGAGFDFSKTRYVTDRFATLRDRQSFSIPVDFYYELTPKMDVSIGYRYRKTDVDRNYPIINNVVTNLDGGVNRDSEDNFFNVGLRGELTPKLSGRVQLGFQDRNLKNDDDTTTFAFISDLTWEATEKTQLHGRFIRDFDTGGQGDSIERTTLSLDLKYFYSPQWTGTAFFEYSFSDYNNSISREDDFFQTGLGLSYLIDRYTTLSAIFTYQDNDSDDNNIAIDNSFDNTIFSLSLAFRY